MSKKKRHGQTYVLEALALVEVLPALEYHRHCRLLPRQEEGLRALPRRHRHL